MRLTPLWLNLLAAVTATATSLRVTVPPSAALPNPGGALAANTYATLTTAGTRLTAPIRAGQADFIFELPSSPTNDDGYILTIDSKEFLFRSYRVDLSGKQKENGPISAFETTRGTPWERLGSDAKWREGQDGDADVILEVGVLGRRGFYEQRASCTFSVSCPCPGILDTGIRHILD